MGLLRWLAVSSGLNGLDEAALFARRALLIGRELVFCHASLDTAGSLPTRVFLLVIFVTARLDAVADLLLVARHSR